MFISWLLASLVSSGMLENADAEFVSLKTQLESYGFQVNLVIPPDFSLPEQQSDFLRRSVRKPYGVLNTRKKAIWINPIVFELGNSKAVLIHEAVHAAQYCAGDGKIKTIGIDLEPIPQARPLFNRYLNLHSRAVEKEAYAVQTQSNSYELVKFLLEQHCSHQ